MASNSRDTAMKKIKLLKRTYVKKIGVCEKDKTTVCDDDTAAYLVKTKHAVEVK